MSTAGLLIAAGTELDKAALQYWMLQRRLEGKTREQILKELANKYDEFEANDRLNINLPTPEVEVDSRSLGHM